MKLYIFSALVAYAIMLPTASHAQYEDQIVKFSQTQNGASARIQGMGGTQIALGGDISSLSGNPAGLGMFTKSEISISPTLNHAQSSSTYFENRQNSDRNAFGLDQIGAVFYTANKRQKGENLNTGWLSVNFGIAYNKTQNYNQSIHYKGFNKESSITDFFTTLANPYHKNGNPDSKNNPNALNASPLAEGAFQSFLIDYDTNSYLPSGDIAGYKEGTGNNQAQKINRFGSQSEFGLGLGANYENKIYIGGSLNFTSINYQYDNSYDEFGAYMGNTPEYQGGQYDAFFDQKSSVKGSGINLKFGAIFRPNNDLRLGISFTTPTWYRINEGFSESVSSILTTQDNRVKDNPSPPVPSNEYSYNMRTPYRISGGVSYVIKKQAIISADIDFIDYKSANFTADDLILEQNMSSFTQNSLQTTVNYRMGIEVKLTHELMVRGGFNHQGSPYLNRKITASTLSGGLGYRNKAFALDFTYANTQFKSEEVPYFLGNLTPFAAVKNNIGNFVMTLGFSF